MGFVIGRSVPIALVDAGLVGLLPGCFLFGARPGITRHPSDFSWCFFEQDFQAVGSCGTGEEYLLYGFIGNQFCAIYIVVPIVSVFVENFGFD